MAITEAELDRANARMEELRKKTPYAVAARYNPETNRIEVSLSTGIDVTFVPAQLEGLDTATAADLAEIEVEPAGLGLHFPKLDADFYLPALLEGVFGSRRWMASRLGGQGGKSRSPAKQAAARSNGRMGGRPKKVVS